MKLSVSQFRTPLIFAHLLNGCAILLLSFATVSAQSIDSNGALKPKDPTQIDKLISAELDNVKRDNLQSLRELYSEFNDAFSDLKAGHSKVTALKASAEAAQRRINEVWRLEEICQRHRTRVFEARTTFGEDDLLAHQIKAIKRFERRANRCFDKQRLLVSVSLRDLINAKDELKSLERWNDTAIYLEGHLSDINSEIISLQSILELQQFSTEVGEGTAPSPGAPDLEDLRDVPNRE